MLLLTCRGSAEIRATHDRTLEFTTDSAITGRATCVVGVDAALVSGGRVAGPVRVTITCGDQRAVVRALASSAWRPGGRAVIRRSGVRLANTLATDADTTAADLPRELVSLLARPDAEIEVRVDRDEGRWDGRGGVVLCHAGADPERLAAEIAAADVVVAEDQEARALVGDAARVVGGPLGEAYVPEGGRVLVLASEDLPGASVTALLGAPERFAVECVGLPAPLAVAAASPARGRLLVGDRSRRREQVRSAPESRLVLRVPASSLEAVFADAERLRGTRTAALAGVAASACEQPRWGELDALLAEAPRGGDVVCCLDPAPGGAGEDEPGEDPFVAALLAEGVPARTVAMALAQRPDWGRKAAYDFVLRHRSRG
uniref:AprA n=1 Tax=Streptoalloteichus tenebrarius (strain ATCC 17920 / DSM 40477 / JCM 4838 / CBS 697.72 / NBRC 16177 / NCIMB 11028 / NRRL B-12390 / A12253. 1 / ISP 5477) TaxID=1933 RepID=Q8GLN7_STRSD|nr:AprA [Streptoalloteichus tenebrarius]